MIKGRATIQLFDEKTGEVVHELRVPYPHQF